MLISGFVSRVGRVHFLANFLIYIRHRQLTAGPYQRSCAVFTSTETIKSLLAFHTHMAFRRPYFSKGQGIGMVVVRLSVRHGCIVVNGAR